MDKRLAIIGAGPFGIEAALRGVAKGWHVTVYEKDTVGAHLQKWGHVRFFSQLKDNISAYILNVLPQKPDLNAYLSGREFIDQVLRPAVESSVLKGKIREGVQVRAIGKRRLIKTELPNHPLRADRPFQLLIHSKGLGEEIVEADVVLDAGGVFGSPNWAGESGLPCPGEREAGFSITRHLPDLLARDKHEWIGKDILVIGDGHSSATAVAWLYQLKNENKATNVAWVVTVDRSRPCTEVADDPLPERKAIVKLANDLAEQPPTGWKIFRKSALLGLSNVESNTYQAVVGRGENRQSIRVQKILSLTGYRPDLSYLEELQIQISSITSGAAGLAKSLLSITDCLAKVEVPPESLESGEKGYFMVGHKSYGRLNTFLLRSGLEQLDLIFRRL